MIAYLKGQITYKSPTYIYVETGGLGYHVNISLNTFSKLEELETIKIYTYLSIKEDSHTLYGFFSEDEKLMFIYLISVSGIGPNTARVILSSMLPSEVKRSILSESVARFAKVKGIGPKTAKRVILDLKDKVAKLATTDEELLELQSNNSAREEAVAALSALGFPKNSVYKKLDVILKTNPELNDVETLIKMVLKQLS